MLLVDVWSRWSFCFLFSFVETRLEHRLSFFFLSSVFFRSTETSFATDRCDQINSLSATRKENFVDRSCFFCCCSLVGYSFLWQIDDKRRRQRVLCRLSNDVDLSLNDHWQKISRSRGNKQVSANRMLTSILTETGANRGQQWLTTEIRSSLRETELNEQTVFISTNISFLWHCRLLEVVLTWNVHDVQVPCIPISIVEQRNVLHWRGLDDRWLNAVEQSIEHCSSSSPSSWNQCHSSLARRFERSTKITMVDCNIHCFFLVHRRDRCDTQQQVSHRELALFRVFAWLPDNQNCVRQESTFRWTSSCFWRMESILTPWLHMDQACFPRRQRIYSTDHWQALLPTMRTSYILWQEHNPCRVWSELVDRRGFPRARLTSINVLHLVRLNSEQNSILCDSLLDKRNNRSFWRTWTLRFSDDWSSIRRTEWARCMCTVFESISWTRGWLVNEIGVKWSRTMIGRRIEVKSYVNIDVDMSIAFCLDSFLSFPSASRSTSTKASTSIKIKKTCRVRFSAVEEKPNVDIDELFSIWTQCMKVRR